MRRILKNLLLRGSVYWWLILMISACQNDATKEEQACLPDVEVGNIEVEVRIERLDERLFALEGKEGIQAFLKQYAGFAEGFLQQSRYPSDTILINALYQMVTDSSLQVLQQEVNQAFGDMKKVEEDFEAAFKRIKYYYPDFRAPKIQTIVTGYGKGSDLYVSEDLIVIGLEFFMGPDYRFQPEEPEYIARRYRSETIVPFVVQILSARYNQFDDTNRTALTDMIFYGKSYYFMQSVIPCLPDSVVLGYTSAQMDSIQKYKEVIWAHYIDRNVFYETSHLIKKDYIDDAPFTLPISQTWCPGAIGRWTGLRIVKKYMQRNEDTSLPTLMTNTDALDILEASKYKGD
ncbi:MAG: gliding motility lipoprotein GldB [Bacteroidota bacterium]